MIRNMVPVDTGHKLLYDVSRGYLMSIDDQNQFYNKFSTGLTQLRLMTLEAQRKLSHRTKLSDELPIRGIRHLQLLAHD